MPTGKIGNYRFNLSESAGTRTPNQCLKRALLYQLSYGPEMTVPLEGIEPPSPVPKTGTLSVEL